jgi:uncharacterized protein (DUF1501 family)
VKRRDFLQLASVASLATTFPAIAKSAPRSPQWDHTLILLELNGGNDGLNTVVPYTDPQYYQLRPQLAIARDSLLPLSEKLAFNPALEALMPAWKANELGIILGVGYASPNRSHFRSIEIWETGSDSDEVLQQGWLARLFSQTPPPRAYAADGIVIGRTPGPLQGGHTRTVIMRDAQQFIHQTQSVQAPSNTVGNAALSHILDVQRELYEASSVLQQKLARAPRLDVVFPKTAIGRQLETAALILASATPVAVIKTSHGSFDTHSHQRGQQDRLLAELAAALMAFRQAMQSARLWDRVLVLSYSEFGRRAAENGSHGTDHGTAAPHLVLGGRVKGGFYGEQPSLTQLRDGDLQHHVDYRSLYATVARNWWQLRDDPFSRVYPPLDCLS